MEKDSYLCVGHSVPRVDALDKVLGRAVYSEGISFPEMLYGRVLRAGIPHALIEEIDTREAVAMKGVACVLTAKDVPGVNRYGIAFQDQEALVQEHVRYAGDPVALIAAESEEIAKEAAKAIHVRYRPLPVITSIREALAEGAPKIHEKGTILLHSRTRKGDIGMGFAQAEPALIPTAPAILNAIADALGVRVTDLPANLENLHRLIREKEVQR